MSTYYSLVAKIKENFDQHKKYLEMIKKGKVESVLLVSFKRSIKRVLYNNYLFYVHFNRNTEEIMRICVYERI